MGIPNDPMVRTARRWSCCDVGSSLIKRVGSPFPAPWSCQVAWPEVSLRKSCQVTWPETWVPNNHFQPWVAQVQDIYSETDVLSFVIHNYNLKKTVWSVIFCLGGAFLWWWCGGWWPWPSPWWWCCCWWWWWCWWCDGVSAAGAIGDDSEDTKAIFSPIGGLNRKI